MKQKISSAQKQKNPNGRGGKLNRSEIVHLRLNPKLRYALDILSKNENRTVSSAIETLVSEGIKNHSILVEGKNDKISIADILERTWDADEAVRFVKTAFNMPHILSHQEEQVWSFVKRSNYYWIFREGVKEYINENGKARCRIDVFKKYEIDSFHWKHFLADWDVLKTGDIGAVKKRYENDDMLMHYGKFIHLDYNPILEPEKIKYIEDELEKK